MDERLPRLKDIISELPAVEHATLRYLCSHLKAISDRHELNCMTVANLASIFGPTILYKESPAAQGYLDRDPSLTPTACLAETNYGLTIAADLLANFCFLFDVSQEVTSYAPGLTDTRLLLHIPNLGKHNQYHELQYDIIIRIRMITTTISVQYIYLKYIN